MAWRYFDSEVERKIEPYLSVLERNQDDQLLVGGNECGDLWTGSLWLFKSPADAPDVSKSLLGVPCKGVSDAKFLPNGKRIVYADYCGGVTLLELHQTAEDCPTVFSIAGEFKSHDDFVNRIAVEVDSTFLTGSMDSNVIVWDVETKLIKKSLPHSSPVYDISMRPKETNTFASAAMDGMCTLWDYRIEMGASRIFQSCVSVKSLVWVNENVVAIGSGSGTLTMCDVRAKRTIDYKHDDKIRRLSFNDQSSMLAVAVDDLSLTVYDAEGVYLNKAYESHEHKDIISSLTWLEDSRLLSAGWDTKVITHKFDIPITKGTSDDEQCCYLTKRFKLESLGRGTSLVTELQGVDQFLEELAYGEPGAGPVVGPSCKYDPLTLEPSRLAHSSVCFIGLVPGLLWGKGSE